MEPIEKNWVKRGWSGLESTWYRGFNELFQIPKKKEKASIDACWQIQAKPNKSDFIISEWEMDSLPLVCLWEVRF